jgi:hypothetical protein
MIDDQLLEICFENRNEYDKNDIKLIKDAIEYAKSKSDYYMHRQVVLEITLRNLENKDS